MQNNHFEENNQQENSQNSENYTSPDYQTSAFDEKSKEEKANTGFEGQFGENQSKNQENANNQVPPFYTPPPFYTHQNQYEQPFNNGGQYNGQYPPNQPPFYTPYYPTEYQIKMGYEKNAVSNTSKNVGFGMTTFYVIEIIFSFFISAIVSLNILGNIVYDPAFSLIVNAIVSTISFLPAAFLIFYLENRKPQELLSYGKPQKGKLLPAIMAGLGFCYISNIASAMFSSITSTVIPEDSSYILIPEGIWGFLLSLLTIAAFPAFLEEFVFRGAIMGSLMKFGKPFAIVCSSALFALIHGNLEQILFAFLVGLAIGFMVVETNSIWTGVIIHFLNNGISVCLDYLKIVLGPQNASLFQLILMGTIILIGLFGLYILCIKNKDLFKYEPTAHISTSGDRAKWFFSSVPMIIALVIIGLEILG